MKKSKLLPIAALLIMPLPALAGVTCQPLRGFVGAEGVSLNNGATSWNNHYNAFRQNSLLNMYGSAAVNCGVGEKLLFKSEINGEYLLHNHQPGLLQDSQKEGKLFFNQAALSWTLREDLFMDVGKIRRRYGYLYSVSPLDLLRNPHGAFRSVHVNAAGDNWPAFYDEGAWGASLNLYTSSGSWDWVMLPKLTRDNKSVDSYSRDRSLVRTNSRDRYLVSYSTTGLSDTTATVSLLAGTQKRLAGGLNYLLSDNWVINFEAGLSRGQTWRHLQTSASEALHNYNSDYQGEPFSRRAKGLNGDIGGGIRYTSQEQIESGMEYYGQSQGYSRSEWQRLYRDVAFTNGGYVIPGISLTSTGPVRDAFRLYSQIMASEIDKTGRQGALQGKHYLMLFSSKNRSEIMSLNWRTSAILNLTDGSTLANLQLSSPVRENLEMYAGSSFTLGKAESEFNLFGEKGLFYAGFRRYW